MISFFAKFKNIILIAIIACFLGSLGYVGMGALNEEYGPNAPVVKVGKEKIKYMDYERALKNAYQNLQAEETEEADNLKREQVKQAVLQELISQEVLKQEAVSMGLGVSDMEVAYYIKNNPAFNTTGAFNKDNYLWIIRNRLGMNAAEFEQNIKDTKLAENYMILLKLAAKASPAEEEFLTTTVFKEQAPHREQIALLKTQTLANNFSQDFNQKNMITFTKLAPSYQEQAE